MGSMTSFRNYIPSIVGVVAAVVYGALTRFIFGQHSEILGSLSLSFFLFTPPALGFLTVLLATDKQKSSFGYMIFAPWISCTICVVLAGVFAVEAWFCIVLALPFFWTFSSFGGAIAAGVWYIAKSLKSRGPTLSALVVFTLLPYLFIPVEKILPLRDAIRTVHSQIEIAAPPEIIWGNITNLNPIGASEQREAFFHLVGLPRPIAAKMDCEQVGCLRYGQWENGLGFKGSVTRLVPKKLYWLTLSADTKTVQPSRAPLSQIGGRVFSMVDDGYEIEYLGDGRSILHLYSTYRLTTRLNVYTAFWVDFLLQDIQRYILNIEKARCEDQATQ